MAAFKGAGGRSNSIVDSITFWWFEEVKGQEYIKVKGHIIFRRTKERQQMFFLNKLIVWVLEI